jgi:hypothetical protein
MFSDYTNTKIAQIIKQMTKLESLKIYDLPSDIDVFLTLTRLRTFKVYKNNTLLDPIFGIFTGLTNLFVRDTEYITDNSIMQLINLNKLVINDCPNITDKIFKNLSNLTTLCIGHSTLVTANGIMSLKSLSTLGVQFSNIRGIKFTLFTNLTALYISKEIDEEELSQLTGLRRLSISCSVLSDNSIIPLTG